MYRKIIFSLFIAVIFILSSCSLDIQAQKDAEVHIIAVALDYANSGGVNILNGTVNDALEVSECLEEIYSAKGVKHTLTRLIQQGSGSDITSENYPSAQNFINAIKSLNPDKNDLIIIYYSGHGTTIEGNNDNDAYFVTGKTGSDEFYSLVSMNDTVDYLETLPCQSLLLIDACYSGNSLSDADKSSETDFLSSIGEMFERKNLRNCQVIAACQEGHLSYVSSVTNEEGTVEAHSEFTIKLLDVLGWRHTESAVKSFYQGGQLFEIKGRWSTRGSLSTQELWYGIMDKWDSTLQLPVYNQSPLIVNIIP